MSVTLDPELFDYDADDDVWVARGSSDFDYADGSEGYLTGVFDAVEHLTDYPIECAEYIRDWPTRYHLSHQRTNLLDSISELIDPSWSVLELGAGLGALTKWLACRVARVDAIEGSRARAVANRRRTKDDANVRVIVGDIGEVPIQDSYDMVTLIGVLEYSRTREACLEMLRRVRLALSEDGILVLAIENRLGAKYWAGCREDHSTRFFDGLLEYPNADSPTTFSRRELQSLLAEAGFAQQQFYHAFPDYKLPTTLIRESLEVEPLRPYEWARELAEEYVGNRQFVMPDPLILKSACSAGLFWEFSNSFMVVCSPSKQPVLETPWLMKKYWNRHRPSLHHTISLLKHEDVFRIERAPLGHGQSTVDLGDYRFDLVSADYVDGELLAYEAYAALVSDRWFERILALSRELLDDARRRFGREEVDSGGVDLLDGVSLDFAFWNLVRRPDGSLVFFDRKWQSLSAIPADYLVFRNLLHVFGSLGPFAKETPALAIPELLGELFPETTGERVQTHLARERDFIGQATGREADVQLAE